MRQLIRNGEYPPGSRLPTERELAAQLQISRPTVREALIALEVEGWINIRVGSGIYVAAAAQDVARELAGATAEGPFELLRAREFIEGAIAAEAAEKATPADIGRLDDVLSRMQAARRTRNTMIRLDREFHTTIAGILGNAVLVRFIGELFDQRINPYFERLSRYFEDGETWRAAVAEHRAVWDAISAGDAPGAKAAMQEHLRLSQERFSRSFGDATATPANRTANQEVSTSRDD